MKDTTVKRFSTAERKRKDPTGELQALEERVWGMDGQLQRYGAIAKAYGFTLSFQEEDGFYTGINVGRDGENHLVADMNALIGFLDGYKLGISFLGGV